VPSWAEGPAVVGKGQGQGWNLNCHSHWPVLLSHCCDYQRTKWGCLGLVDTDWRTRGFHDSRGDPLQTCSEGQRRSPLMRMRRNDDMRQR